MSDRAAYSRVYWSVVDDPKFATIYDDDRHLATWLRLLLIADQAHPASANIPNGTRRASVAALVVAGLIDLGVGSRYRVHGLDAEREWRSEIGRAGGLASGRSRAVQRTSQRTFNERSTAPTNEIELDETRRDETRRDDARSSTNDDDRADLEAFLLLRRRVPTPRQRKLLDEILDRHDLTGPAWAADLMYRHPDDPIGAVIEADKAWRAERIAEAQAAEKPKPKPHRPKGLPESTRDILDHWAAQAKSAKEPTP